MPSLSRGLCFLAAMLMLVAACSPGEPGVIVAIEVWPAEAKLMRVHTSLNGTPGQLLEIKPDQIRFVVRVDEGQTGLLSLTAEALDAGGCKLATGSLEVSLGLQLHPTRE